MVAGASVLLLFRGACDRHGGVPRPLHRRGLHDALLQNAPQQAHCAAGHRGS